MKWTPAPLHARSHDIVWGVPGTGKTTLAKALVRTARRVVFFDRTGHDYTECGESCTPAELAREPELLAGLVARVVVVPGADLAADFRAVVTLCREHGKRRPLVLVADEVGDYQARTADALTSLHRNGHHDGVASLLVAHFAVDVPKTCRRSASRVLSLLQDLPDDLNALAGDYGQPFADDVRAWQPGSPPAVWTRRTLYPQKGHSP